MATGNPCDADLLLYQVQFGGTDVGLVTAFNFGRTAELVKISGEAKLGPSCVADKKRDYFVIVDSVIPLNISPLAAAASLVIKTKKMDGTTVRTHTFATMRPFEYAKEFDRDNPEGSRWRLPLQHVGDMDTDPLTIS